MQDIGNDLADNDFLGIVSQDACCDRGQQTSERTV